METQEPPWFQVHKLPNSFPREPTHPRPFHQNPCNLGAPNLSAIAFDQNVFELNVPRQAAQSIGQGFVLQSRLSLSLLSHAALDSARTSQRPLSHTWARHLLRQTALSHPLALCHLANFPSPNGFSSVLSVRQVGSVQALVLTNFEVVPPPQVNWQALHSAHVSH